MAVGLKLSALRDGHWHEYALRFALGGLATACAGAIAKYYGPLTGGLFLAFPAIFTASATIVEKHERQRKERQGLLGRERGKNAAALESCGAALGSWGMVAFAAVVFAFATRSIWFAFIAASIAWFAISVTLWSMRRPLRRLLLLSRTSTAKQTIKRKGQPDVRLPMSR
jgi:hypothetical protein